MHNSTLGAKLREIRLALGWSLRDAESHSKVSNGYLYLLEAGKVQNPRPNILHKLADAYKIKYDLVMEWAGYISKSSISKNQETYGIALSSTLNRTLHNLSPEELKQVTEFISFLKSKSRRSH